MGNKNNSGRFQIIRRDFLRQSTLAGLAIAGSLPDLSWAVRGDQLHIRNYLDVSTLDPPFSISGADGMIADAIFQNLLQFKSDGTWETDLDAAEHFEAIDDTHYAFRLKRGQMFTNGFGEMTADDVKFSFERMIDPNRGITVASKVWVHGLISGGRPVPGAVGNVLKNGRNRILVGIFREPVSTR